MLMSGAPKDPARENFEKQDIIHNARSSEHALGVRLSMLRSMQKATEESWDFLYTTAIGMLGDERSASARTVHIVGIGIGNRGFMTRQALDALMESELITGAQDDIDSVMAVLKEEYGAEALTYKRTMAADSRDEITRILDEDDALDVSVIYRGDVGYYDSAGDMLNNPEAGRVDIIPGVSILGYFAARLKLSCESGPVLEFNDTSSPLIYEVSRREYVFLILNGKDVVRKLSARLLDFGFRDVFITVGLDIGTENEQMATGKPLDFMRMEKTGVFPAVINNPSPLEPRITGRVEDRYFARGQTPVYGAMVRSAILNELVLNEASTVYVIGAGIGECAIECALACPRGKVYALDEGMENVQLMRVNRRQFLAENMEIISGTGPEILENMIYPDRVLISGELSQMRRVISIIFRKNKHCRMVICTQDVQVLARIIDLIDSFPRLESNISSVRASYSGFPGAVGAYGSEREVYIISCALAKDPVSAEPEVGLANSVRTVSWVPEEL